MNKTKKQDGGLHELASLYALDVLGTEDKERFERHLDSGCTQCEADVRSYSDVAVHLANSVAVEPPAGLRNRLLDKARGSARTPGILMDGNGLLIARSSEIAWKSMAPGIRVKRLYFDEVRKYDTSLVHMEAGAHYPSHHHKEIEELFVLSGDLHVEGQVMQAGDYCRADSSTLHSETFTDSGCTFLLLASPENEVVA
jgi:anti-sigma factor ChrR (cupin superfamily)